MVAFRFATALAVLCWTVGNSARADDRPFVYAVDAVGGERGQADAMYSLNVGTSSTGAVRFVDPTISQRGVVQQIGAQYAATDWLSIGAFGLVSTNQAPYVQGTGGGYVHFTALRPDVVSGRGATLGFTVLGLREFGGVFAMSLFVNAGYRVGGFEMVGNAQFERRFSSAADPIDLLLRVGANYDVVHGTGSSLRLGVEYVGQDLEDAFEDEEAEGGAVHLLAFSSTATLLEHRLHLGLAPGAVFAASHVGFGGRMTVGYTF